MSDLQKHYPSLSSHFFKKTYNNTLSNNREVNQYLTTSNKEFNESGVNTIEQQLLRNNQLIFEQIKIAKKNKQQYLQKALTEKIVDKQSSVSSSQDKLNYIQKLKTNKDNFQNLAGFMQDGLIQRLIRQKFTVDHQNEQVVMKQVGGDISHFYDKQKNHPKRIIKNIDQFKTPTHTKNSASLGKIQVNFKANQSNTNISSRSYLEEQNLQFKNQITIENKVQSTFGSPKSSQEQILEDNRFETSTFSSPRYNLFGNNQEIQTSFTKDLNTFLTNNNADSPAGRVQSIRLMQWFGQQKAVIQPIISQVSQNQNTNNLIEGLIQVTVHELTRQVKLQCIERGFLLEQIWDFLQAYIQQLKDTTNISIKVDQLSSMDEFNRIHKHYKDQHVSDQGEIESMQSKCSQEQKVHQGIILQLDDSIKSNIDLKSLLQDYKKAVQLSKKKIEQLKRELELVSEREKQRNELMKNRQNNDSSKGETSLNSDLVSKKLILLDTTKLQKQYRKSIIFYNPDQVPVGSQAVILEDATEDDINVNGSNQNLFSGLLDDKNIVEIDNMIMNMDKVVKVNNHAQQIDADFMKLYQVDICTQTNISSLTQNYDLIFSNQKKLDQVLDNEKLKEQVQSNLKYIDDRLTQYTTQSQLNNLINKQFFIQNIQPQQLSSILSNQVSIDESIYERQNSNGSQLAPKNTQNTSVQQSVHQSLNQESFQDAQISAINLTKIDEEDIQSLQLKIPSIQIKNRLVSPFTPISKNQNPEVDKLKIIISMLKSRELQLHMTEQSLEQSKSEFGVMEIKAQDIETKNSNLLLEMQSLRQEMLGMRKIDINESSDLQKISELDIKNRVRRQARKQVNQAKLMMFNSPNLGQKVSLTYDFQKITNAGVLIVEKVKAKQVKKLKNFMPIKLLMKQITLIYLDRVQQQKEQPHLKEQDMSSFTYSYFLSQFGISKIAEQKFLILILSVKHHKSIMRINVFAKFLGLFDVGINYNIEELKKYLEAYDFITNVSQLGVNIQDNESDIIYYSPYIRAVQYIGTYADSRMTQEEREELKKDIDFMKENDPKNVNKAGLIDFDQLMIQLFSRYRILVSRAKEYVINAFAACDLDGNGMCNYEEWYLLLRHIEPNRFSHEQVSEIFFTNADLFEEGEQNFSFEKFAVVCVEHGLFSDEAQHTFISCKGTKAEIMSQFYNVYAGWQIQKLQIESRFDKITFLASEKLDHWREIIDTFQKKMEELHSKLDTPGIDKKVKPLLIAYLLLLNESILLEELQEDHEDQDASYDDNTPMDSKID